MKDIKIERHSFGNKYTLTLDSCDWVFGVDAGKELTLQDLIDMEGLLHALILKHSMGDKFYAPKENATPAD